jgi:hypothetical protein
MISDYLIPELKKKFADKPFVFRDSPERVVSLAWPYEGIGPLEIFDEGDVVVISIQGAGDGHFGGRRKGVAREVLEARVAADVVKFLEALFSDQVVVMRMLDGKVGGWRKLADGKPPAGRSAFCQQFLWSGPV